MLHRQIYILWRQSVTQLWQVCVACQLSLRKDKHSHVAEDCIARTHSIPNLWDGHLAHRIVVSSFKHSRKLYGTSSSNKLSYRK